MDIKIVEWLDFIILVTGIVECDPLANANPARKPTEIIVGQNAANTPF